MTGHRGNDFFIFLMGVAGKFLNFIKWVAVSAVIGVTVGLTGTAFSYGMQAATDFRTRYPAIVLGMPAAGILIVLLYHLAHRDNDKGTNSVLSAVRSEEQLYLSTAPLIFVSTILTHLFGGSAGREGAALQLGGSLGNGFGRLLRMKDADAHVMIMCGMSACFSALFGTPMAAAIFPMEVVSVGVMYYAALVPCVLSALIASGIAEALGAAGEQMSIAYIPEFTWVTGGKVIALAVLSAVLNPCDVFHAMASTCPPAVSVETPMCPP